MSIRADFSEELANMQGLYTELDKASADHRRSKYVFPYGPMTEPYFEWRNTMLNAPPEVPPILPGFPGIQPCVHKAAFLLRRNANRLQARIEDLVYLREFEVNYEPENPADPSVEGEYRDLWLLCLELWEITGPLLSKANIQGSIS